MFGFKKRPHNYTLQDANNEPWVKKERSMIKEAADIRKKYNNDELANLIFFMFIGNSYATFQTFLNDLDKRFRASAYARTASDQFVDALAKNHMQNIDNGDKGQ